MKNTFLNASFQHIFNNSYNFCTGLYTFTLSQSSSNNYILTQQQIIQPDILPECSFLDNSQCPSSQSVSTEPAANHEISNVVVDQSCSYINGGSSATPIGQVGSPLGETINPEIKNLYEFVKDLLDNGSS